MAHRVFFTTGAADVEASDARGGRAPDPRDHGKESTRRQTGQHADRDNLRQMRRTQPRPGGKRHHPRQVRLQAMRPQARDALSGGQCVSLRHCEPTGRANARPMTGSAKQSIVRQAEVWIASSLALLAMTKRRKRVTRYYRFYRRSPMNRSLVAAVLLLTVTAANAQTPYAGMQTRSIKALSETQVADLGAGRGMGLALAAELNGYPGPSHVLELADRLELSADQRSRIKGLFDSMKAEAVPLGAKLIE